jgi:hypothetical protein
VSSRRDRHQRGLRGPLALPNTFSRNPAKPFRSPNKADFFADAVDEAVERIGRHCPDALVGITFGIEDVPYLERAWTGSEVPLAAAISGDADRLSQVVVYRRPLEHRAATRQGLRILVYRTVVEQLAALTGRSVDELDPEGGDDYD